MRTARLLSLLSLWAVTASGQQPQSAPPLPAPAPAPTAAPPARTIPPQILLEVRELERQFDQALLRDCAPERCSSKGCVYKEHLAVDLPPSTTSLPGLGSNEGIGAVPAQLYLTQARCEFTHEKAVPVRDVEALARRLEQRLSKGFLKVIVSRQVLDPINPALADSPPPKEDKPPAPKEEPKPEPVAPPPPPTWDADVALRELWQALLPHFSWMIAVFLATLATLVIIWGARRLGKETLEEKAMLAQLTQTPATAPETKVDPADAPIDADKAFVDEQQSAWARRIADAPLEKDDALIGHLLREWLKQGEFALLAKATVRVPPSCRNSCGYRRSASARGPPSARRSGTWASHLVRTTTTGTSSPVGMDRNRSTAATRPNASSSRSMPGLRATAGSTSRISAEARSTASRSSWLAASWAPSAKAVRKTSPG